MRIVAACIAAAMLCSIIRVQRPELATALSLATGVAVLAALAQLVRSATADLRPLMKLFGQADDAALAAVARAAGIGIVTELGAQLCADAGETALGGRIALAARVAILCLCLPLAGQIAGEFERLLF